MVNHWLEVLFKRKYWIILITLIVFVIGGNIISRQVDTYEASSTILVKFGHEYLYIPAVGDRSLAPPASLLELVNAEMQIMAGEDLKLQTIEEIGVERLYPDLAQKPGQIDDAVALFEENLYVATDANSHVVHIWFRHEDPSVASDVVNTQVDRYLDKRTKIFASLEPQDWDARLAQATAELDKAQSDVDAFKRQYRLYAADDQITIRLDEKSRLESEAQTINSHIRTLEGRRNLLQTNLNLLSEGRPSFGQIESGSAVDNALDMLLGLRIQEQELRKEYGPNHPRLVSVQAELATAEAFIENLIKGQLATVTSEINRSEDEHLRLRGRLEEADQDLADLSQRQLQFREMERSFDLKESEYKETLTKYRQAALSDTNVRVIEPATPPSRAIGASKLLRLILAAFIGFCLAIGGVIAIEALHPSFATTSAVERHLGIPVLATFSIKRDD